ncbi:endoglucanase Z-like [Belonocnema kinseyi]|uniref:endoglucanase Z-like n=1 Tax=Belonocnema kinseyi TaxID=2817044 RepID=UPI00143CC74F|nr:endoglucanase Z-like [Belonocnema kinseyi]
MEDQQTHTGDDNDNDDDDVLTKQNIIEIRVDTDFTISGPPLYVLPLSVKGNKILIGEEPGSLAGNSLFWTNTGWGGERFYNKKLLEWLKSDWKSNLVRAAMGVELYGGYLQEPQKNKERITAIVDAAIANDMYVIIDWHTHYSHQDKAIEFFEEMAKTYCHTNNVIYEIWNEPKNDVSWKDHVKPYALAVIEAIRAIDQKNLIVVGTTNWSKDVDVAAADPVTGFDNIAYALHFYASSCGHCQELRNKASIALEKNVALFVTEWGTVNVNGSGGIATQETNDWFKFMEANKLSHANWSISDKPESVSALKQGVCSNGGWSENDLTESGKFVRNLIRDWHEKKN